MASPGVHYLFSPFVPRQSFCSVSVLLFRFSPDFEMAVLNTLALLALANLAFGLASIRHLEDAVAKRDVPCSPQNMECGVVSHKRQK